MAHKALLIEHATGLVVGRFVEAFLRAGDRRGIGRALKEKIHRERYRLAIRRQLVAADVQGQGCHGLGFATVGIDPPELVHVILGGEEIQALAIHRPARRVGIQRGIGEPGWLAAAHRHGPDARLALVRRIVGLAQLHGGRAAIRRQLRIADPVHHDQILDLKRMRRGNERRRQNQQEDCNQRFHWHQSPKLSTRC